ncbi:MAG: hypothetical protein SGJ27_04510 [Candidatus Melainabacteria bacterium]|nr:hypothetical protein [Candidatus Melainabacteria bacterium]
MYLKDNDWSTNEGVNKKPDAPDNFLGGQLLASRNTKRQVTADHVCMSYWKQAEISPAMEEATVIEDAIPPRAQYAERVLHGLFGAANPDVATTSTTETSYELEMDSFTSILPSSAKQKLVDEVFMSHITERNDVYYEEGEDSRNSARGAA